jgi:succinate dehydrogenase flavin-adding protein (antitoxin of CptAB toxin-antitoxin module)
MQHFKIPSSKLQELIEQSDRDIADYIMGMDALMEEEPIFMVKDWRRRREFWLDQLSR